MVTGLDLILDGGSQAAALHAHLVGQGVQGPDDDQGVSVHVDPETGAVTVDADRNVTDLAAGWTPPPTRDERIAAATTLSALKAALLDGGG